MIDILQAKQMLENQISGLATGTGVSMGTKEILIYVSDYSKEQQIRNRVGPQYEGYNIRFIISGNVVSFQ